MTDKTIESWSFSKMLDFERCKFYAYLKHACKIPEPQRPLKPGQTEQANDRGSRIHDAAENYVRGLVPLTNELTTFAPEFAKVQQLFKAGKVSVEEAWGFREDWTPMDNWYGEWKVFEPMVGERVEEVKDFPKWAKRGQTVRKGGIAYEFIPTWHRSKLDIFIRHDRHTATVVDLKTGKKDGNEVKHNQQVDVYAIDVVSKHPEIEEINVELWYPDKDDILSRTLSRQRVIAIKPAYEKRGRAVTRAMKFEPNPNKFTCMYCQYGPWNGGQCRVGVR